MDGKGPRVVHSFGEAFGKASGTQWSWHVGQHGPMEAKIIAKLAPLTRELKIGLDVQGFKMEFMVVKL
jgi:hypothetical protein